MTYSYNPLASLGLDKSIPLDGAGKIPSDYLPSYVDDVVEYDDLASFPGTGETGKIYVAKDTGYTYRWTGSVYVRIGSGGDVALNLGSQGSPSLYFTGDPNTGIYSPGADQLALSTNGVQRINIEADGDINIDSGGVFYDATNNRLGIGNTSPAGNLHILSASGVNTLYLSGGTSTANNGGTAQLTAAGPNGGWHNLKIRTWETSFETNGLERGRWDSSGRLLVGTSSNFDGSTLQVNGNISQSSIFQQYTASFTGDDVTTKTLNITVNNPPSYETSLVEVKGSFARGVSSRLYYYKASFVIEETGATASALFDESANGVTASLSFSGQTASLVLTFSTVIRKGAVCVTSVNSSVEQRLASVSWA